ncbi:MAG: class II fructose-bisphosphate aldolase, partial [Candidatus Moranbacteria bacterium]|nr:class II fructose-bisphosphate aldolase [Candidatus Moranbacteria bacterium]
MKTLRECVQEAREKNIAIGHFNVSNLEAVWAIFRAAKELNQPVIIGVSEGERKFVGTKQITAIVKSIREEFNYPIFLNSDHTHSFESVKEVVEAGFDGAMIDGSKFSFDENVELTKKTVDFAREFSQKTGKDILIEGELGYLGASSKLLDEIPEDVEMTTTSVEDAKIFVEKTGVDVLAPSIGNIHGMVKSGNPHIDSNLVKKIAENTQVQLVLHGGSGIVDEEVRQGIKNGISIVHVNTEIRVAFREGLEKSLKENDSIAPYKYLQLPKDRIYQVVLEKIKLFA